MTARIGVSYISDEPEKNRYVTALRRAGADPVVLATAENCPRWLTATSADAFFAGDNPAITQLEELDGLLLTGGGDIDPMLYGETMAGSDPPEWPRDHLEIAQFQVARRRGIPILGICRGLQFLNVAMGGSLIQHLPNWPKHRAVAPKFESKQHRVRLDSESRLARILVDDRSTGLIVAVNSRHHQAVTLDRLAPGLIGTAEVVGAESAWSEFTIVEGIETSATREGREFVLGVQWHPERVADAIPSAPGQAYSWQAMSERLFSAFVSAALTPESGGLGGEGERDIMSTNIPRPISRGR